MDCTSRRPEWMCLPDGSTVAVVKDGKPVVVEQGPAWLVELAHTGPEWLPGLLQLALLAVVMAGLVSIYARGITVEQAVGVVRNSLLVACVMVMSYLARDALALTYLEDVAVGGVGGFVVSAVVFRAVEDKIRREVEAMVRTSSQC